MMSCGLKADEVTLASVVSACASLNALKEGLQIHAHVVKFDKLRDYLILCNALVDMYAKCGRIREARRIFDRMPVRSVVSETLMISGYAKAVSVKAARLIFSTEKGVHYTFGNILSACANLADLRLGKQAHAHVLRHGSRFQSGPESNVFVGNSLIDMYMKCGSVEDGSEVFHKMRERDWVSWNAVIIGYSQNGYGTVALEIFWKMLLSGEKPDHVTMIGVLCACSHAGLVEEGRQYFRSMSAEHGLVPQKDHYTCLVDLLGRAGRLNEVKSLIETMPMQPDAVILGSLLGACKVYCNIEMGEYAADQLLEIDPGNSGPYVLLSNMYAELGRWGDVVRIRKLMRRRGVIKQPGCSWIEIHNEVHVFLVKDRRHPQKGEIYEHLKTLTKHMKRAGYVPDVSDMEADEEQSVLESNWSEQLEVSSG